MTQMKPRIKTHKHGETLQRCHQSITGLYLLGSGGDDSRLASYLVLLLEAVALGTLHLGDVLQQVGHSDGRVQLPRLIGQRLALGLPLLVVGLDQAAGLAGHGVTVVWKRGQRPDQTGLDRRR